MIPVWAVTVVAVEHITLHNHTSLFQSCSDRSIFSIFFDQTAFLYGSYRTSTLTAVRPLFHQTHQTLGHIVVQRATRTTPSQLM